MNVRALTICFSLIALFSLSGILTSIHRTKQLAAQETTSSQLSGEKLRVKQSDKLLLERLTEILIEQQVAWNAGDIDAFMGAYLPGEGLTFSSGGQTRRGWEATKARYQKSYPDKKAMGELQFSEFEVEPLGPNHALMLGRWKLVKEEPAEGNFSLVWRKIGGQWLIIHDHSSSNAE